MKPTLTVYNWLSRFGPARRLLTAARDAWSYRQYRRRGHFSQHGEDLFVLDYFGPKAAGRYVDIGASHPFRISNTYLLYTRGWSGVTVEPIPELSELHRRYRPRDTQVCAAVGARPGALTFYQLVPSVLSTFDPDSAARHVREGAVVAAERPVPVTTLADLLANEPAGVDFLSVDAEGFDDQVLAGNDWGKVRPQLVLFERNEPAAGSPAERLLVDHGYKLLRTIGCNLVYERT